MTAEKQDADAYLAACSELLVAIATGTLVGDAHLDTLLASMPDRVMRDGLRAGLCSAGLCVAPAWMEHG